jgi:ABC-type nitrate/sulfonate/bicarbonate transport system substrate-binding protein
MHAEMLLRKDMAMRAVNQPIMKPTRRTLITGLAATALAGRWPVMAQTPSPSDLGTVTIGWTKTIAGMSTLVAMRLAPKYGIKIESVNFNNSVDVMTSLVNGQVDVGLLTAAHVIRAIDTGVDLVEIAGNSRGNVSIIISSKLDVKPGDWKGLQEATRKKKLRIASSRGSINELLSIAALVQNGLDVDKDFELVNIAAFAQHAQALRSGEFDVVFSTEPSGSLMVDEGIGVRFSRSDVTPAGGIHTDFSVRRESLQKDRAKIKAFLQVTRDAVEWLNADKERTLAEAKKAFPMKTEALLLALDENKWDMGVGLSETQALAKIAVDRKFASRDVSSDLPKVLDDTLLKEVVASK